MVNPTTKDFLTADQVEPQNNKNTCSDSRHERADQVVNGHPDPLTAIGLCKQPAKEGEDSKDDYAVGNPMMAGESLHPSQDGRNLFFCNYQQAICHAGQG